MSAPDGRHPPIDGLRALAAIAVLLTHAAIYSGLAAAGGTPARYAQRLEVGVAVFFVISGFVLYRPFLLARLDGARAAARRALRGPAGAADRARVLARADGRGDRLLAAGRADAERDRHLLRLRPDLLDGHVHRRARAGLDAVRGGHLLRLPAAVGVADAARRPGRACAARRWRCSAWRRSRWPGRRRSCGAARPTRSCCRRGCTRCPPTSTTSRSGWGSRCWSRGGRCRAGCRSPASLVALRRVLGREPADRDRLRSSSSRTRAGSGWGGTCSTA